MARVPRLSLFPLTAEVSKEGHLMIGGCDTVELAADFGTPLYIFDESGLRRKCAEFKEEFGRRLCFCGAIDIQKALPGSKEDVETEVRTRIGQLASGGGYILGTAHNVQADCPVENVEALLRAYKELGQYGG